LTFVRNLYDSLLEWKNSRKHKPLVLRGARQVGKTTLIRQFSKEFDNYIELNLERAEDLSVFDSDNVNDIFNKAQLLKGVAAKKGSVLLFIDEIQESPKAIGLLRYFYEDRPEIHVVAAGSLLEFAMEHVGNMPVGRVLYRYLHPLNFPEYLMATGNTIAQEALVTVPLRAHAHSVLLSMFNQYCIIGGMPEIISDYLESQNTATLQEGYRNLWATYVEDVEKYSHNATERKVMAHIISTAHGYLERIKFEGFGNSAYRSREVGEAFRSLEKAKLIRLLYPTTVLVPPIVPDRKKRPRLQFLDTGLLNHTLEIQGEMIGLQDLSDVHRGHIIQHLVCQELISIDNTTDYQPNFWVREEKDANSEVDVVYRHAQLVIPVEVKSGKQGRLRSLHQFVDRSSHPYAVRMYGGELSVERHTTPGGTAYLLLNLPYFLATQLPAYLAWFINNHKL